MSADTTTKLVYHNNVWFYRQWVKLPICGREFLQDLELKQCKKNDKLIFLCVTMCQKLEKQLVCCDIVSLETKRQINALYQDMEMLGINVPNIKSCIRKGIRRNLKSLQTNTY